MLIALGVAIAVLPSPVEDIPRELPSRKRFGFVGILIYGVFGTVSFLAFETVGFIIVAALVIVAFGVRLGARPLWLSITAVVVPVLAQLLFEHGFGVPLAHGILGGVLG